MKKQLKGFLAGVVVTSILMSNMTAIAATVTKTIKVVFNPVKITVNGKSLSATNFSYNGTYYVPVKSLSDSLGKTYSYNSATKTVSINDKPISPPAQKVFSKADLPYTITAKNGMAITFNSYEASTGGIKLNVTLKNNSTVSDKGGIMTSTYEIYDGKSTLKYIDQDDIFYDSLYLKAGQSITGNINFQGLSQTTDTFSLYGGLWQNIDREEFKITFKVE